MHEFVAISSEIPVDWYAQLEAIAQSTHQTTDDVVKEAIALYLSRHAVAAPSMSASAGVTYADLESEPDEVLLDFLEPSQAPTLSASDPYPDSFGDEDEPDEILPGFL